MKKLLTFAVLALFAGGAYAADENKNTPQQEKMKACNTKAGAMKGDERKAFMKTCLSAPADPPKAKSKMAVCNEKTKGMNKPDADKARSECMKAS